MSVFLECIFKPSPTGGTYPYLKLLESPSLKEEMISMGFCSNLSGLAHTALTKAIKTICK